MTLQAALGAAGRQGGAAVEARRIVVLSRGDNASWAYLLRDRLERSALPVVLLDSARPDGAGLPLQAGDRVVICRYLSSAWRALLERMRPRLAGLVYFMDDDLLDLQVLRELPWRYALKVYRGATRHRRWLERHCDAFWVSTPALARRYASLQPEVLPLRPPPELVRAAALPPVRICYHGSLPTHRRELEWLRPVIESVQRACPHTHVELFGDVTVQRLYRGLPRVSVVHQLSWPAYLDYSAAAARDIGLAPLCPGRFNAARGAVKFFDFARMGAVGLYARAEPYADWVRDGEDGLLLDEAPESWVRQIVELAHDAPRRARMAAAAQRRALELAQAGAA